MPNLRRILLTLTAAMFLSGIIIIALVLFNSLKPSVSKLPTDITSVKLSSIEPGVIKALNKLPGYIVIFRPNKKQIDELIAINNLVNNPKFTLMNIPKLFIYRPLGSSGCRLLRYDRGNDEMQWTNNEWPGGWIDPCHSGAWDYAGRAMIGINSSPDFEVENLQPLPYTIEQDEILFYPLTIE